jgi:MoaA/NifB/PqqE/SkfB family radical SAM enzyme
MRKQLEVNSSVLSVPEIISGFRLLQARNRITLSIFIEALRRYHKPLKALKVVDHLRRERRKSHGNSGRTKAVAAGGRYFWTVNLPGWPSNAFTGFINNEFKRIDTPEYAAVQTVIFGITNKCPLNCLHCYEWDNLSGTDKLSLEELKNILKSILGSGVRHIQFSGGEPLSRFGDLTELMRYGGRDADYWINTSGYGLTREKAQILKDSGLTGALISLDHWDKKKHNEFRGNDKSFEQATDACRNCHEAGIIVSLALCPGKDFINMNDLYHYYALGKKLHAGFIRILEPRAAGRYAGKDVQLDPEQIEILENFALSRNSDSRYTSYPIIQYPGYHQRRSGCKGAGSRYIYIDPNGNFHACPFCRGSLGNSAVISLEEGITRAKTAGCQAFKVRDKLGKAI